MEGISFSRGLSSISHIVRQSMNVAIELRRIENKLINEGLLKTYIIGSFEVQTTKPIEDSPIIKYVLSENPKLTLADVKEKPKYNANGIIDDDNQ